jgi:hypothetical protein
VTPYSVQKAAFQALWQCCVALHNEIISELGYGEGSGRCCSGPWKVVNNSMKVNSLWVETSGICSRSVIYLSVMFSGLGDQTWPRALLPLAEISTFNTLIHVRRPASLNQLANLLAYISSTSPDNLLPAVSGPLFLISLCCFLEDPRVASRVSSEMISSQLSHVTAVPCLELAMWCRRYQAQASPPGTVG